MTALWYLIPNWLIFCSPQRKGYWSMLSLVLTPKPSHIIFNEDEDGHLRFIWEKMHLKISEGFQISIQSSFELGELNPSESIPSAREISCLFFFHQASRPLELRFYGTSPYFFDSNKQHFFDFRDRGFYKNWKLKVALNPLVYKINTFKARQSAIKGRQIVHFTDQKTISISYTSLNNQ